MELTWACSRLALAIFRRPEHTSLLPPSTAHRLFWAPAKDTAPEIHTHTLTKTRLCQVLWTNYQLPTHFLVLSLPQALPSSHLSFVSSILNCQFLPSSSPISLFFSFHFPLSSLHLQGCCCSLLTSSNVGTTHFLSSLSFPLMTPSYLS